MLKFEGTSGCVMVNKIDKQTFTSEFDFHLVPHSYILVPHLSKKLSKLKLLEFVFIVYGLVYLVNGISIFMGYLILIFNEF